MVNLTLKPTTTTTTTIKFLCSYGGKILPRHPDGKLRYHGGHTRVLAVDRSISFSELLLKLGELCGTSVSLRCQLPTEDLDALVSITSDEDLSNLIEEYDGAASPPSSLKIRAFLSPPKSIKKISPPLPSVTAASSSNSSSSSSISSGGSTSKFPMPVADRNYRQMSTPPVGFPVCLEKSGVTGKVTPHHYPYYAHGGYPHHIYLVHNGNHWQ